MLQLNDKEAYFRFKPRYIGDIYHNSVTTNK